MLSRRPLSEPAPQGVSTGDGRSLPPEYHGESVASLLIRAGKS